MIHGEKSAVASREDAREDAFDSRRAERCVRFQTSLPRDARIGVIVIHHDRNNRKCARDSNHADDGERGHHGFKHDMSSRSVVRGDVVFGVGPRA